MLAWVGHGMVFNNWVDAIAEAAERRFAEGKPLFLAQIPPLLHKAGFDFGSLLAGRTLREAINIDGSEKLQLVRDPANPLAWAVVPKSAPSDLDLESLFLRSPRAGFTDVSASQYPRFKRWFWTAFLKALGPAENRWILPDRFVDLPDSTAPPDGAVRVESGDIVETAPNAPTNNAAIHESIQKWATRTNTHLDSFTSASSESEPKPVRKGFLAFDSLGVDDLKRIMVPLDIVVKLLRR